MRLIDGIPDKVDLLKEPIYEHIREWFRWEFLHQFLDLYGVSTWTCEVNKASDLVWADTAILNQSLTTVSLLLQ